MTDFHAASTPPPPRPSPPRTTAECARRMTRAALESVIRGQQLDTVTADALRGLFPNAR